MFGAAIPSCSAALPVEWSLLVERRPMPAHCGCWLLARLQIVNLCEASGVCEEKEANHQTAAASGIEQQTADISHSRCILPPATVGHVLP